MEWLELTLSVCAEAVDATANMLQDYCAGGVVIDDPRLISVYAQRNIWDAHEFSEELLKEKDAKVSAYLPVDHLLDEKIEKIKTAKRDLEILFANEFTLFSRKIKEEDWANNWKQYFKPKLIGKRTVIKPSWEDYTAREGEIIVEIDPGMAFGTGDHATTALCLKTIEDYVEQGHEVIDLGTGSGILSIAAALLGAQKVWAYDYDYTAVKIAGENVARNGLGAKVAVAQSDLLASVEPKADLIIANIIADIILRLIPELPKNLKPEGLFISSGIIMERAAEVRSALKENHFVILETREEEGWVVFVARAQSLLGR